jgi:hypothetical protein
MNDFICLNNENHKNAAIVYPMLYFQLIKAAVIKFS